LLQSPPNQKQKPKEETSGRRSFKGEPQSLSLFGLYANISEKSASPEWIWRSSQMRDLFNTYQKVTFAAKRTNRDELFTPVISPKVDGVLTLVPGLPGFG